MKLLRTITEYDIDESTPISAAEDLTQRQSARAVVFDDKGKVALLFVGKHDYYKLPGGGVEEGEDIARALEREMLEEIGCTAEVTKEVGRVIEYRQLEEKLEHTSDCFIAIQTGEKGLPEFTDEEVEEGFKIVWAESIDEAILLTKNAHPANRDGKFKRLRELTFLEAAKELL